MSLYILKNSLIKQKEARLAKVEAALFQAQVDSLNRKKTRTITTIDSRVLDGAGFPFLDTPVVLDSALKQYRMIKKEDYYDKRLNPGGKGIKNKYEKKAVLLNIVPIHIKGYDHFA